MGLLSDLFTTTEANVQALHPQATPIEVFGGADIKGIDVVRLSHLAAIVLDVPFADALSHVQEARIFSDDGPWIMRLSPAFVAALASLERGGAREAVATRWASCEEFAQDGWQLSEVSEALSSIVDMASRAVHEGNPLFVWQCL